MPGTTSKRGPKSDKIWSDAIRRAVHGYHEEKDETGKVKKTRWLNKLAENLVLAADKGDVSALKEVGDRLDGKPAQSVIPQNPDGSALNFNVTLVSGNSDT